MHPMEKPNIDEIAAREDSFKLSDPGINPVRFAVQKPIRPTQVKRPPLASWRGIQYVCAKYGRYDDPRQIEREDGQVIACVRQTHHLQAIAYVQNPFPENLSLS